MLTALVAGEIGAAAAARRCLRCRMGHGCGPVQCMCRNDKGEDDCHQQGYQPGDSDLGGGYSALGKGQCPARRAAPSDRVRNGLGCALQPGHSRPALAAKDQVDLGGQALGQRQGIVGEHQQVFIARM